jgi:hypothetical protein
MNDITVIDETGQEHSFTVSDKITDAILALLSALELSRVTLPSNGCTLMREPVEQTRYKV